MKKGIFVTEMNRFDFQNAIINSCFNEKYYKDAFKKIQCLYPNFKWYMLSLNETLEFISSPDIIILSRNTLVYKNSISNKFPKAIIKGFDSWAAQFDKVNVK